MERSEIRTLCGVGNLTLSSEKSVPKLGLKTMNGPKAVDTSLSNVVGSGNSILQPRAFNKRPLYRYRSASAVAAKYSGHRVVASPFDSAINS